MIFDFIKKIFSSGDSSEIVEVIKSGATLLDVRTQGEFRGGSLPKAINIPVSEIGSNLQKLKKNDSIVVFCRSGMRSRQAQSILKNAGFEKVYNAGSFHQMQNFFEASKNK